MSLTGFPAARRERLISSLTVAGVIALTVLFFAPSQLFFTNSREFNVPYIALAGQLLLIALPVFLGLAMVLFSVKNPAFRQKLIALILGLSLLLWLQGNILIWDYGVLTGGELDSSVYYVILNTIIWLVILLVSWSKSALFIRHSVLISGALIVIQLVSVSIMVFQQPDVLSFQRYEFDTTNEVVFSGDKNVIVLVLDTFQSDVFQQIIGEDESYLEILDGFTYFPDALAGFPFTYESVPNMLTGQFYDNSVPFATFLEEAYLSSSSVLKVLIDEGFIVECYPNSDKIRIDSRVVSNARVARAVDAGNLITIYDATFFKYLPDVIKPYIYNNGRWFLQNLRNDMMSFENKRFLELTPFNDRALTLSDVNFTARMLVDAQVSALPPNFKFYRLEGAHSPFLLNEELDYEAMGSDGYARQAKASLKLVDLFLRQLKTLGVFDNSFIFIVGDHGINEGEFNLTKSANPLFLVKTFDQSTPFSVSYDPVSLSDISATILVALGFNNHDTPSIFDIDGFRERERFSYYYNFEGPRDYDSYYLPGLKEFVVTGPVWEKESWRFTGNYLVPDLQNRPFIEWGEGFYLLEKAGDTEWRWCASEGTLIVNNSSQKDIKLTISGTFSTGHPEFSTLHIDGSLFSDDLLINNKGTFYSRTITVPQGTHSIQFFCDALSADAPLDQRHLVFKIVNFEFDY